MDITTENYSNTSTRTIVVLAHHYIPLWYIVTLLVIGLFGMLGNAMTIIVLFKRKIWTSVNLLVGIMSVSDFCVIPFVASVTFQSYLAQRFYTLEIPSYIRHTFMASSIVSAVLIGCERALAVRHPLKFKEKWTTKLTLRIFVVTYLVYLTFVMARPILTELLSHDYFKKHLYLPYFIIVRGLPFVAILIANIMVIRGLLANSSRLSEMGQENVDKQRMRTETAITRTVLVLTSVYFLCMVPSRILFGLASTGIFVEGNTVFMLLISMLEMTNFSVNMIIYTMTSKLYRMEYAKLLGFCCSRRWSPREIQNGTSLKNVSNSN